jgi:hypothetical protein
MKGWVLVLFLLPGLAMAMGNAPRKPVAQMPGSPAVMLRDDVLRASPQAAAERVANLGKGQEVRTLTTEGGWTQVYAAGQTGWVRILSVKTPTATSADLGALAEVGQRPNDPGKVVAVAGARGLEEEDLKAARYAPEQLLLLDTHSVSSADARQFARISGLSRRDIPYFPGPEGRPSSSSSQP